MSLSSKEKSDLIISVLEDMKAQDTEILDIRAKSSIADYFVICTGTSDVHVRSITDKVVEKLNEQKIKPYRKNLNGEGWMLLDFGDVIVHVMKEETRQFYDLETLWKSIEANKDLL